MYRDQDDGTAERRRTENKTSHLSSLVWLGRTIHRDDQEASNVLVMAALSRMRSTRLPRRTEPPPPIRPRDGSTPRQTYCGRRQRRLVWFWRIRQRNPDADSVIEHRRGAQLRRRVAS